MIKPLCHPAIKIHFHPALLSAVVSTVLCVSTKSVSDYSKVNWLVPPTVNAQGVLDKLRELGIPQVPPDTIYLGKNPRSADEAKLPIPKGWTPKEVEPKEADPKAKEPEKLKVKPKDKAEEKKTDDDE